MRCMPLLECHIAFLEQEASLFFRHNNHFSLFGRITSSSKKMREALLLSKLILCVCAYHIVGCGFLNLINITTMDILMKLGLSI